jgi:hypothetical protein
VIPQRRRGKWLVSSLASVLLLNVASGVWYLLTLGGDVKEKVSFAETAVLASLMLLGVWFLFLGVLVRSVADSRE